ncbi:gamma-glutamylcyclotransferase [Saccharophagus degradans]|uniref:gamma-glutamylcyclotransferase family protein n=1 Tax=Saccharophagus degradans TaxID=86304 RepID=UPI0024781488|nr:gamma-glutamylcyclotransferase family protein [Saccharophagus degradans]WGO99001.1 gamma-glutamylcyclotransferase [Saccharophagus degradans]
MSKHIFTYGSLMFAPVWRGIVDGEYRHSSAAATGIKRVKIVGQSASESYPVAFRHPSAPSLTGQLYLNVEPSDLQKLDAFEGSYYQRETIQVIADGAPYQADIYLLKRQYLHLATELPWSPQDFERDHLEAFIREYSPA